MEKSDNLLIFENTSQVIRAESILKRNNYKITVVGPPPNERSGCDLAIAFPAMEEVSIIKNLKRHKIVPSKIISSYGEELKPVDLFHHTDYGEWLMVRAANMKITVDKKTLKIVNISGGGCPDIPFLATLFVGSYLYEIQSPKEEGYTLCAYTLDLAYEEIKRCF